MIIVFGSNVLDLFFHTPDLPPRDQNRFLDSHDEAPGGKGANQAVAAAKAGATVYFSGALGRGGHGRQMFDNLNECGVDASGIKFIDGPSGLATIFVDETDGTHRIVVSHGANLKAKQEWIPDHLLNKGAIVLVQGELPIQETEKLLVRARKNGARTMMNFAPATAKLSEDALHNLDFIILNEHEADAVARQFGLDSSDKEAFATLLHKKYALTTIVTLGPDGSLCACDEGIIKVPSLKIKAIDTVGAGDAFVGYLAASLDKGLPLREAMRYAAVAGSLACTRVGAQTAVPASSEVNSYLPQIEVSSG